jgi:hypothetical protein
MSKILPSLFTVYELTEEELTAGQTLTACNLMVLNNMLSQYATEKLSLRFDPASPSNYLQAEAELMGQINLLRQIISSHEEVIESTNNS